MFSPSPSPFGKLAHTEESLRTYVEGIRARHAESLGLLYDQTSGVLYSLAIRVLNNPADAEEVVLDVYQKVWSSAHTFDPARGSILGWLFVLTRSRAIDRLRSAGARRSRELPIDNGWEMPSASPAPESQSIFEQERRMVREALATLVPEQREPIELAFFRGLTHVEVAETLGEPLGTIKTRIRCGMRKLREALAPVASVGGNA